MKPPVVQTQPLPALNWSLSTLNPGLSAMPRRRYSQARLLLARLLLAQLLLAQLLLARLLLARLLLARLLLARLLLAWLLVGWLLVSGANSALRDGFDEPAASWRPAGGDAQYQVVRHIRTDQGVYEGSRCEQIELVIGNGSSLRFAHDLPRARVIDELRIVLQVRSERPDVQLLARVVLPRTRHPQTGHPLTLFVRGTRIGRTGRWQPLQVANVPRLLDREVWLLRSRFGSSVDAREAYVDQVLLDLFTGPGPNSVLIDALEVVGLVRAGQPERQAVSDPHAVTALPGTAVSEPSRSQSMRIERQGSVLLVDGRPILPRIIPYQGEPLPLLKGLGFNLIRCADVPSESLLAEAAATHMGVICPPPFSVHSSRPWIGPGWEPVVAWDFGGRLSASQLASVQQQTRQLRQVDPVPGRLLVGRADAKHYAFSRSLDILLSGREPLGSSLELKDYATWLSKQSLLARPGTPFWAHVQTQIPTELVRQRAALVHGLSRQDSLPFGHGQSPAAASEPHGAGYAQIELLASIGLSAGCRGLLFDSDTPVSSADPETRRRALALEMVNLKLGLVEPWLASADVVTTVRGTAADVTATVLASPADQVRLLLAVRWTAGSQWVAGSHGDEAVSFVSPAISEASEAYEVTPVALRRLRRKRVTGGVQVILDSLDTTAMILLTQDPRVERAVAERIARQRRRAAQLARDLAALELRRIGSDDKETGGPRAAVERTVRRCDELLHANQPAQAYDEAARLLRSVRSTERARWFRTVAFADPAQRPTGPPAPALASPRSPGLLASVRNGGNRLAGGDFEDLSTMVRTGWLHHQYREEDVLSAVELSTEDPKSGRSCLRLRAWSEDPQPAFLAAAPVWVTTPAMHVAAGERLKIHGWVRVRDPVLATVDRLMIVDSLGGPAMAQRIGPTPGWQEFTLHRVAFQPGPFSVSFVLSGLGQADVDSVSIVSISNPTPKSAAAPHDRTTSGTP